MLVLADDFLLRVDKICGFITFAFPDPSATAADDKLD